MRIATTVTAVLASVLLGTATAQAATWSSSDQWAEWSTGGYTVRQDCWASNHGPETIYANSSSNFWVDSTQPATDGVKCYPHSARNVGRTLSSLATLTSSFNVTLPGSGVYNAAYDIWANSNAYEVMIWENRVTAGPLGSKQTTASIGGVSYDVYRGNNGHEVYSFVRGNVTSGGVDILSVLKWLRSNGWWGDVTLGEVQFGFEISSTGGATERFTTNSYSVSFS
ncbi:hypothetical protein FHX82_005526 [Amycolatopsis bartoniae]|uniref:Glycosyl hydrolase family 12 n=1 Tax=Amycolatopsis bartoniae TaxID=941986 RepID=A0A8H9IWP0_9PSEU|nr:hypothetical protein [Amycolatopsis bartoniae]MBB2938448.1 hypothetical protein [Amycolatopsis bartoniae]TVT10397.1 hypothetical protein FNH07_05820 [Amycolatopsis bartoniae]GHF70917.1 hypothetical protein GCM10017566_50970 [Amycolatopsis bartoniae]